MPTRDELADQILALPVADRMYLADLIDRSIIGDDRELAASLSAAWTKEIDRRLDAYDRGEVQAVDADAALDELDRRLEERRKGRGQ